MLADPRSCKKRQTIPKHKRPNKSETFKGNLLYFVVVRPQNLYHDDYKVGFLRYDEISHGSTRRSYIIVLVSFFDVIKDEIL